MKRIILLCFFAFMLSCPDVVGQRKIKQLVPVAIRRVARLTGKSLPNENLLNPNRTDEKYDIGGTDLGIAWDMGKGKTGLFFGDTYGHDYVPVNGGGPGAAGNWRSNVLGITTDKDLSDGLSFDNMVAKELIPSPHITNGTGSHTSIPTAAIHAMGADFVHYMDVRKWGVAGSWTTNFSGLFYSKDQGLTWKKAAGIHFNGDSHFSQVGFAKHNGWIYMIGTRSGRTGAAYLARFKEANIVNQASYQYWNRNTGWVTGDESKAEAIIEAPVGELSLLYNSKYKRWILTYLNEQKGALVMRDAASITGFWSEEKTLATATEYPGLYGAFLHPISSVGDQLYFMMSLWFPYNVFLMQATLKFEE